MTISRPRCLSAALLATTALNLFASHAHAQTASAQGSASASAPHGRAPSMLGATAPQDERPEEQVMVKGHRASYDGVTRTAVGGGLMVKQDAPKSISTVTRDFISKQAAGSNPMNLIALLPGVNFTSQDALGLSGGSMSMRGLQQNQIGYTLEGFPLNDIGNYAIYQQEIADPENLQKINVAQGSADLDSPHISATGGVVDMYMLDPKTKFGGLTDFSYGSYGTVRGFLRLDSGYLGRSNWRAYASFSDANEGNKRAAGQFKKLHGEGKIVNEWGQGNRFSFAIVGNELNSNMQPYVTKQAFDQYGYGVRGTTMSGNTIYNTIFTGNNQITAKSNPVTAANNNYYGFRVNPFTNIYASAPSAFTLTDNLTFNTTPYFWYGNGNGGGAYYQNLGAFQYGRQSLPGSINGKGGSGYALLYNPSNTQTYRPGDVSKLTLTTGINRLEVGFWFEYSKQRQTAPYSFISNDGSPLNVYGAGPNIVLSNGRTAQYRDTLTQTRVRAPFIADSLSLFDNKLTIDAGLRFASVTRQGHNGLPDISTAPNVKQTFNEPLPQVALRYQINAANQIFASGSTNMRIPTNISLYDGGSFSKGSYGTRANLNQKPEISISVEAGYRYTGPVVMGSATYFHYNFTNRLFSQVINENGVLYTTNINAGGQVTDGVDAEFGTRPILYHIRPYISAEYLNARLSNNFRSGNGADYLPTSGKFAPQTPKYMVSANLDYDDGSTYVDWNLRHVAKQYATLMNDQSIPNYTTMNLTAGYRFHDFWKLKSPFVQVNFVNLAGAKYLGFAQSVQANAVRTRGLNGTSIAGSNPTYAIAAPFSVIGEISTGF